MTILESAHAKGFFQIAIILVYNVIFDHPEKEKYTGRLFSIVLVKVA